MRVIARMNVGGPAVQVAGLMRGIDARDFEQRLYTGFCATDEADYLNAVAVDVSAIRIEGFGRRVSLQGDLKSFLFLVKEIRSFKPHILHTHTAKAGFLGRVASMVSLHPSIRVHTFHGHLLNGYFGRVKRTLVVIAEKVLGLFTDQLLAVGERVRQDLLQAGIGSKEKFGLMPPGLILGPLPEQKESQKSFGLSVGLSSTLPCYLVLSYLVLLLLGLLFLCDCLTNILSCLVQGQSMDLLGSLENHLAVTQDEMQETEVFCLYLLRCLQAHRACRKPNSNERL
jgi:hypothetical protein